MFHILKEKMKCIYCKLSLVPGDVVFCGKRGYPTRNNVICYECISNNIAKDFKKFIRSKENRIKEIQDKTQKVNASFELAKKVRKELTKDLRKRGYHVDLSHFGWRDYKSYTLTVFAKDSSGDRYEDDHWNLDLKADNGNIHSTIYAYRHGSNAFQIPLHTPYNEILNKIISVCEKL